MKHRQSRYNNACIDGDSSADQARHRGRKGHDQKCQSYHNLREFSSFSRFSHEYRCLFHQGFSLIFWKDKLLLPWLTIYYTCACESVFCTIQVFEHPFIPYSLSLRHFVTLTKFHKLFFGPGLAYFIFYLVIWYHLPSYLLLVDLIS